MFIANLAISALLVAAPRLADSQARSSTPELLRRHLVDIGGRSLNFVCVGNGTPTIVFDEGLNGNLLRWQKVVGPAGKLSRACFFERAGYGYSDPSDRPMTADNITDDLHRLLKAASVRGRVILVGHSIGGLYATLYADKYPDVVAGLVLIDPVFAGAGLANATAEERAKTRSLDDEEMAAMRRCADLAKAHLLSRQDHKGCFDYAPGRTPDEIAYLTYWCVRPFQTESVISEIRSGSSAELGRDEDSLEEQTAARSFGQMPMVVLTAGRNFEGADRRAERDGEWKAGHDRLAARSTRGVSLTLPNSGHYIQLDDPDAVVDAIATVVREVRTSLIPAA